jgi:phosphomannomutase/phosphoglucomutase
LHAPSQAKFVVGGDTCCSTPGRLAALSDGLCSAGVNVVDLGILPTPMIYYAKRRLRAEGCAIVAASRNSTELGGLKWMVGDQMPTTDDIDALQADVARCSTKRCRRHPGVQRQLDISYDYVAWLQETWVDAMNVERRIVVDPTHGSFSRRARRYLQAIFPRSLFYAIHDEPDPQSGDRWSDRFHADLQQNLAAAVEHEKADLGIAFDGDGDRVVFVDHEGNVLSPEETTCSLLRSFNGETAGSKFVYDLNFSKRLPEIAKQLGAVPLPEGGGLGQIHARMRETEAFFGAETTGHYFFRALEGGDDGLFTACWLIAWLAHRDVSLAELRAECPPIFITPDFRVRVQFNHQSMILNQIRAAWSEYPQTEADGVHIDFPHGWALVRSSVTEPALTFRFESTDWTRLRDLVWTFCDGLSDLGDELWMQFTATLGNSDGNSCCR